MQERLGKRSEERPGQSSGPEGAGLEPGYSIEDMIGISPSICTHIIHLEEDSVPTRDHQRRLNPQMQEVPVSDRGCCGGQWGFY